MRRGYCLRIMRGVWQFLGTPPFCCCCCYYCFWGIEEYTPLVSSFLVFGFLTCGLYGSRYGYGLRLFDGHCSLTGDPRFFRAH